MQILWYMRNIGFILFLMLVLFLLGLACYTSGAYFGIREMQNECDKSKYKGYYEGYDDGVKSRPFRTVPLRYRPDIDI
jgi:hypothetical protein